MAAQKGRDLLLKVDATGGGSFQTVAGLRASTIAFNAQSVDATSQESVGAWRELLAGAGLKSAGLRGQGIFKDAASDATVRGYFFNATIVNWQAIIPLRISEADAHEILARDVERFARGVRDAVTVELSEQQFSALVSFAYNVGLGGLKRSSVLTAVNARDFEAVPRRLNLWTKAGGRVLPGLVRRRAAEGALFMSENAATSRDIITPASSKPILESRTMWSAMLVMLLAVLQAWLSVSLQLAGLAVLLLMVVGLGLIIFERYKKMKLEGL